MTNPATGRIDFPRLLFFYYIVYWMLIRYLLTSPPFLTLNAIFIALVAAALPVVVYFLAYGGNPLKETANLGSYWKYMIPTFLILNFLLPFAVGFVQNNETKMIVFDLLPVLFLLPAAGFYRLFNTAEDDFWRELFILLIVLGFCLATVYYKEFIAHFYYYNKNGAEAGWSLEVIIKQLNKLKNRNRHMFNVVFASVAVWVVLWHSRHELKRRFAIYLGLIAVYLAGAYFLFYSRNQLLTFGYALISVPIFLALKPKLVARADQFRRLLIVLAAVWIVVSVYNPIPRAHYNAGKKGTLSIRYHEQVAMLQDLGEQKAGYLLGAGLGSYFPFVSYPGIVDDKRRLTKSHNSFLNFLYKGGPAAMLFMFAFLLFTLERSFSFWLGARSELNSILGLYLFTVFSIFFIRGAQDVVYYGVEQMGLLGIHLALLFKLARDNQASLPGIKS